MLKKLTILTLIMLLLLSLSGCSLLKSAPKNELFLELNQSSLILNLYSENPLVDLVATVKNKAGQAVNVKSEDIKWIIENVTKVDYPIASLNLEQGSNVVMEAKEEGEAKITVSYKDISAEISVKVIYKKEVDSVDILPQIIQHQDKDQVYVKGYWEPSDGGGGIFEYDANSTEAVDMGMVFAANGQGRWLRVVDENEPIDIRWYGARSDVNECQATYLQAAIDYFYRQRKPGTVFIPEGTFSVGRQLGFYEGVSLIGAGIDVSVIKNISGRYNSLFNRTYHYSNGRYLRMTMSDLTFDVDMYNLGSWIGAIWIEDYFRELTIERVKFTNSGGNIIRLMKNSVIADSIWDNMDGRALSTGWENRPNLRFRDNEIRNNIFIRTAANPTDPGINLSRAENNVVVGNQVININPPGDTYGGIRVPNGSDNNLIEDNYVKNFHRGIWVMSGSQNNEVRGNTIVDSWSAALFINSSHERNRNTSGNIMADNIIIQENPAIRSADLIRIHEDFTSTIINNIIESNEVRITSSYYNSYQRGKTLADGIVYLTNGAQTPGRNIVSNNVVVLVD